MNSLNHRLPMPPLTSLTTTMPVQAQVADLIRDAERYRFLRDSATQKTAHDVYGDGGAWNISVFSADQRAPFDTAVDRARVVGLMNTLGKVR